MLLSRKCLFFKSVWLSLSTCYCGLTSLLNARDCFPSFHKDVKQLRSHETLQTGEYIFIKGLLNISTLMLEETISRLEQDFATSPIIHYLILNVQLSFNFLDNSLYLFYRDFSTAVLVSQGLSRCCTCFTAIFPMLYCCTDHRNVTRNYFCQKICQDKRGNFS